MATLASFKAFLNTGHLGPMRPGLSMNEVANLLGPPPDWIANGDAFGPAPSYWCYNFLEINVRCDTDFCCDWFQIEHADCLRDEAVRLADDLFMSLDGLSGETPMSRFIEAIDDIDRVQVFISGHPPSGDPVIWIGDTIAVWFDDRGNALGDAVRNKLDLQSIIQMIEAEAAVTCVYSYREPDEEGREYRRQQLSEMDHLRVTGREFLAALSPSHTAAS